MNGDSASMPAQCAGSSKEAGPCTGRKSELLYLTQTGTLTGVPIPLSGIQDAGKWEKLDSVLQHSRPVIKERIIIDKIGNDHGEFSLLEMTVRDGEETTNVIFMGRWLSDSTSKPSAQHPKGIQYLVASTPTNSYFVFRTPLEAPEHCNYELYDSFEWMEESHEIPPCILEDVSYAEDREHDEESDVLEA